MENMTPEERWTKIENGFHTLLENQARQEIEIAKNTAAIRDLIVVSRILIESQKETVPQLQAIAAAQAQQTAEMDKFGRGMEKLRLAQEATDETLRALIHTVDRIIRSSKQ